MDFDLQSAIQETVDEYARTHPVEQHEAAVKEEKPQSEEPEGTQD